MEIQTRSFTNYLLYPELPTTLSPYVMVIWQHIDRIQNKFGIQEAFFHNGSAETEQDVLIMFLCTRMFQLKSGLWLWYL